MTALEVQIQLIVEQGLAELERHKDEPYYEASADAEACASYYADIRYPSTEALSRLLGETHTKEHRYDPPAFVYPWLDQHPDGMLRSIYSDRAYEPEEFIRRDAAVARERMELLLQTDPGARALVANDARPAEVEAHASSEELEMLSQKRPYNCEHVVCQSWFEHNEPMRGDLHHLFACESGCNSFRGNYPYYDFDVREIVREECGRREEEGFEPGAHKGPVARATLYFLLRYPGVITDARAELPADRLPTLLAWHAAEPPAEYEFHRNAVAAQMQGNRNPLIDHPEWAESLELGSLWAKPAR